MVHRRQSQYVALPFVVAAGVAALAVCPADNLAVLVGVAPAVAVVFAAVVAAVGLVLAADQCEHIPIERLTC